MDYLATSETFTLWLGLYGNWALFILLALGIIALPVPEESLMILAGLLIYNGKLNAVPTFFASFGGSVCGITVSYLLGIALGALFLKRYGKYVGLNELRQKKVHDWFEAYGKWTLVIGYFIPGVRHLTGFAAGSTKLEYANFAMFAYFGALIWVSFFLSIGYFFGDFWLKCASQISWPLDEMMTILLAAVITLVALYFYFKKPTS